MKSLLRALSGIVCAIALLVAGLGVVAFFSDSRESMGSNAMIIGVAMGVAISAGILWMLTEISAQLARKPEDVEVQDASTVIRPRS